jgi:hypothetical protein
MSNDTDNDDVEVRIDPEEFLCGFTTPERAAMLALAFKTLTAYGYEGVVDEYITITRESESAPPEYVLGAVDDLINNIQKDAFRTHGRIMVKELAAAVVGRIITAAEAAGKIVTVVVTTVAGTKAAIMEAVGTKEETTLVATAVAV